MIEAVVIIFLVALIVLMLVPALRAPRDRDWSRIDCLNNLKQVGLAYKVWAGDNNEKYPMDVSVTNGGAMECAEAGDALAVFQVMSNELSTPKILYCRIDEEHSCATNFGSALSAKNISYFVGLDTDTNSPQKFLSGDDNFEVASQPIGSGIQTISANNTCITGAILGITGRAICCLMMAAFRLPNTQRFIDGPAKPASPPTASSSHETSPHQATKSRDDLRGNAGHHNAC